MLGRRLYLTVALLCVPFGPVLAACPSDEEVKSYVDARIAGKPTAALAKSASLEDAMCAQEKVIRLLQPHMGKPVGYKVALTSKPAQEQFGAKAPIYGVLFDSMLLREGDSVKVTPGLLYEPDLIVVVKDEGINSARTPEDVLKHISQMVPFIEIPSPGYAEGEPVNAVTIAAANAGASKGVTGAPVPVEPTPEFAKSLAEMKVVMVDQDGKEIVTASGGAILGHPLNAAIFLADELKAKGQALKAGDMVSLGSFSRLQPAKPGLAVTLRYDGLPHSPKVTAKFTE
jgi:2-oxo-hept-3-ene-1,7-dioate hydratase